MPPVAIARAELLAVGTELLLGEIVDTNSAYLARELAARSVDVYWSQRVGDNRRRIAEAIRSGLERSDLVLVCGGLGPTDDDLTREAIADVLGETPTVDPGLEATLRERFARMRRPMPAGNLKQAWLVPSADALPNPNGTAPGWFARVRVAGSERYVVALPGPPRELVPMWSDEVVPRLAFPTASFAATTLKTFGVGESHVAELLAGLTEGANPSVATYAKRDGVHVRVAAKGEDERAARALLGPVLDEVRRRLGDAVWGSDGQELPELVLERLAARGERLVLVDAATSGTLAELLGEFQSPPDAGGGSGPLLAAVIAWRDEALALLDATPPALAGRSATQSIDVAEVAAELAERGRARCAADYGVAVAPWRAAAETTSGRPAWSSAWAVAGPGGTEARIVTMPHGGHAARRERLAYTALVALWSQLTTT
jgi:nicotinamide-nucleotide amidase